MALIAITGRSQRFLPGAEIRSDTVLLAIHRDHVVLRDQDYEERLYFPKAEGTETTHATSQYPPRLVPASAVPGSITGRPRPGAAGPSGTCHDCRRARGRTVDDQHEGC